MLLINYEVNLILTWSPTCINYSATVETKFTKTETKRYAPVVTLSTQDNAKLLQQLKSGFKSTFNWNKYESNTKIFSPNRYLNHLVNSSFQGVSRLFVLSFENQNGRTSHSTYYLSKVEINYCNVITDVKNFFNQPINSNIKTHQNVRKIATGQGDGYTTDCLLVYFYFKDHYEMIAIDLSKQQVLDVDPTAIQQINFTANLDRAGNTAMFFIIEEAKETVLDLSKGTMKVL